MTAEKLDALSTARIYEHEDPSIDDRYAVFFSTGSDDVVPEDLALIIGTDGMGEFLDASEEHAQEVGKPCALEQLPGWARDAIANTAQVINMHRNRQAQSNGNSPQ